MPQARAADLVFSLGAGTGYLRGYLGDKATIGGISIDAGLGLLLNAVAALFGFSVSKVARMISKTLTDLGTGALATWATAMGAVLGRRQREAAPQPLPRPQAHERVKHYLEKLRERIASRTDYQRAVFQELKRTHDFDVRVSPSGREFTLSIALPSGELMTEGKSRKRLMSVVRTPGERPSRQIVPEVSGSSATET